MVPCYHNRSTELTVPDHLVYYSPKPRPFSVSEPADSCGQSFGRDSLLCELDPVDELFVVLELLHDHSIGLQDVIGVSGDGHPSEGPSSLAEHWPDEQRDKPFESKCLLHARLERLSSDIISIVEY